MGKRKTTNALYLTDRQGLPLAMSEPVAGNHNDLYDIEVQFEVVTGTLEQADIPVEGLFLNADAGFDYNDFRRACERKEINASICFNKRNGNTDRDEYFDKDLYDERYSSNFPSINFQYNVTRFETSFHGGRVLLNTSNKGIT